MTCLHPDHAQYLPVLGSFVVKMISQSKHRLPQAHTLHHIILVLLLGFGEEAYVSL